jgi:hypothetical protein
MTDRSRITDKPRGHFGPVVDENNNLLPGTAKTRRSMLPRERRRREALLAAIRDIVGPTYDGKAHVDRDTQYTWRNVKIYRNED